MHVLLSTFVILTARTAELAVGLSGRFARQCSWLAFCALASSASAFADEPPARPLYPQAGECVIFREGGGGYILKAPSYWLKGSIAEVAQERRLAGLCPRIGKPTAAFSRDDWLRVAAATPCVESEADVREVPVLRVRVLVEAWETPWSNQHGTAGWLFRGQFLNIPLRRGEIIDMDASWLERCE